MSLVSLILKLKPLLEAPDENFREIVALLKSHSDLAEYEVARYFVARAVAPRLSERSRSSDPRIRKLAADGIRMFATRKEAGRLLRPLSKDPDPRVRSRARHAVHALHIDDVALPDRRYKPPRRPSSQAIGGWNATGWAAGLFRPWGYGERRNDRNAKATTRKTLIDKYGLPSLGTPDDVAQFLGLKKAKDLQRFLRAGTGPGRPYVEFEIPKASGEPRKITAPKAALRKIQRKILDEILAKLPVHEACHGFVRGRSVLSNARPHQGARVVIKMDLRDFFPTIHYHRVRGLFSYYGYGTEVAKTLAGLVTHRCQLSDGMIVWPGALPQGAPTSPALANLLCGRLDSRLSGLAAKVGATYTRYADDLTFSFKNEPEKGVGAFLWWVDQVCQQEGFLENAKKRRVLRPGNQQRVTGIVVNAGLHVPRALRRSLRATLHNCKLDGVSVHAKGRKDFRSYLLGMAAYIKMVQPALGRKLLAEVRALFEADRAT